MNDVPMASDVRVAWRNLRQYRSRIQSLVVAVVLGSVISFACVELVGRAADAAETDISESVALRTVEIREQLDQGQLNSLREPDVSFVQSNAHVTSVEPWLQASFGIKSPEIGGALLYATPIRPSAIPPLLNSTRDDLFPLRDNEVILPARSQGEAFDALVGEQVPVTYTRKRAEGRGEGAIDHVTVVAVYDPAHALDGPAAAYADSALVIKWAAARAGVPDEDYVATIGYDRLYAIVDAAPNVAPLVQSLREAGFNAVSMQEQLSALPGGLRLLRTLGIAVFVLLLGYGALAGAAISSSFMRSRAREIGLLNALGFRRRRILRILLLELALVGAAAGLVGASLGVVVSLAAEAALGGRHLFDVEMPTGVAWPDGFWTLLILLTPVVTLAVGGLLPARRAARMQPDMALRDQV